MTVPAPATPATPVPAARPLPPVRPAAVIDWDNTSEPLSCPFCGSTSHTFISSGTFYWTSTTRLDEGGVIVIDVLEPDTSDADGDDDRLLCGDCHEEFALPDDDCEIR